MPVPSRVTFQSDVVSNDKDQIQEEVSTTTGPDEKQTEQEREKEQEQPPQEPSQEPSSSEPTQEPSHEPLQDPSQEPPLEPVLESSPIVEEGGVGPTEDVPVEVGQAEEEGGGEGAKVNSEEVPSLDIPELSETKKIKGKAKSGKPKKGKPGKQGKPKKSIEDEDLGQGSQPQPEPQPQPTSKSTLKKSSLQVHEEGEDGEGEYKEGEDYGQGQEPKPRARKSITRKSQKFASNLMAVEKPEKGQGEPPEITNKEKGTKPKKGTKKGKKGKKTTTKEVEDLVEVPLTMAGSRSSENISKLSVALSTVSQYNHKRKTGFNISASQSRRGASRSRSKSGDVSEGSSSSSEEEEEVVVQKRRTRILTAKASKASKKKRDLKEGLFDLDEEEEVVQKIVVPSVTSTGGLSRISKKPDKPKTKGKKGKGKGKKQKKPKAVKTEAQLEEEAKAKAEEERLLALQEKKGAIAKEEKDLQEAAMRGEQLDKTFAAMEECDLALDEISQSEQATEEWRQYLVCDGLPAPWDVPGMNTYLHLWDKEVYTVSSDRCKQRTNEAINLLDQLDDIRDDPFDKSPRKLEDWEWVASRFREYQALNLEYCTYRLLRDIKSKMNRIDIPTADFRMQEDLFSLCLWVSITQPTPTENPRSVAKARIGLEWPEMSVDVLFPPTLKREMVAIRGMYTKYDHLTDTCGTFKVKELPAYYSRTLKEACNQEILTKMKYKYDQRVIPPKQEPIEVVQEDGTIIVVEPEAEPELEPDEIPPHVPYQKLEVSASEHFLSAQSDEMGVALRNFVAEDLPDVVLNLRKYTVIGGIYYLDLFYQPPQPQGMVSYEVFISTLTDPYSLQIAPYVVQYEAPPPHEPGTRRTPEEIEEELLQQEKELDELIFMQIILPKHVYWLEPPMVVQWDKEVEAWATHSVFDFKNIEEKGYVTFRTGIFSPVAIATLRWSNLPYQAWEIRPEKDGTVTFQLSCAILTLEFHVQKNTICVKDIQSAPNDAFDKHLNVYYHFSKLRKIMKSIGIDVFPYFDTFLYVEGTCEKYWPMENHLYFCMAYMSVVYNMTWSRWNMTLDYKSIVYQMRAYRFDRPKQANFDTLSVNAQRTVMIDCTEVSAEFSDTPVEGMRFYADLWHLVRTTTARAVKSRITNADKTMVKTLYRLYKNVRFLSFS